MKKNIFLIISITICLFFSSVSGVRAETDVEKYCKINSEENVKEEFLASYVNDAKKDKLYLYGYKIGSDLKCIKIKKMHSNSIQQFTVNVIVDLLEDLPSDNTGGIKVLTKDYCKDNEEKCSCDNKFQKIHITDNAIDALKNGGELELTSSTIASVNEEVAINNRYNVHDGSLSYNEITASSCDSLLGVNTDPDDPAYYVHLSFVWIKYIAIILLVVMSMKDFAYAVVSKDEEAIKKATSVCTKRFIYCILIFVLPIIVEQIMGWANIVDDPSICGLE